MGMWSKVLTAALVSSAVTQCEAHRKNRIYIYVRLRQKRRILLSVQRCAIKKLHVVGAGRSCLKWATDRQASGEKLYSYFFKYLLITGINTITILEYV
jgi:hypothetical protein